MEFSSEEIGDDRFTNYLQLGVCLDLSSPLTIVFRSASRSSTTFEIFDEDGGSLGFRRFDSGQGPVAPRLGRSLVDDLNVALGEYTIQIDYDDFSAVVKLAVEKCESRHGNGIVDGDCILTINKLVRPVRLVRRAAPR